MFRLPPNKTTDVAVAALTSALEPILMLQTFYGFANALALRRGLDPDAPPFLAKVTRTL